MKKTRKVGSGRKKGSYSFCNVTLETLNKLLRPSMNVKVSRKWAVDLGVVDTNVKSIPDESKPTVNVQETEVDDEARIEVKETEW
tara:strand:+ start:1422 stop:1676 length:255 start_codon:yes stop_codon:yes gene_type:complete